MAQNEIQKYQALPDLYNGIRQPLSTFRGNFDRLQQMAEFLNSADAATYPGIPVETLSDLGQLRTAINTFLASQDMLDFLVVAKKFVRI